MDTTEKTTAAKTVHVNDADRRVILHPENNHLFVRSGKQVIEACRLSISIDVWMNELAALMGHVQRWAAQRASRVRACYCAPRGAKTVVFFVPASQGFDFDLADELAELTSQLVKDRRQRAE